MFPEHDPATEVFDPVSNGFFPVATANPFACDAYLYTSRGAGVETSFMATGGPEDSMQIIFEQGKAEDSLLWEEEQYGVTPSWRSMLLKQGQLRPLCLGLNWKEPSSDYAENFSSLMDNQLPPGCTMGDLIDYISTTAVPYGEHWPERHGVDWYRTVASVKLVERLKTKYKWSSGLTG